MPNYLPYEEINGILKDVANEGNNSIHQYTRCEVSKFLTTVVYLFIILSLSFNETRNLCKNPF